VRAAARILNQGYSRIMRRLHYKPIYGLLNEELPVFRSAASGAGCGYAALGDFRANVHRSQNLVSSSHPVPFS
jgi:hypothetical protein